MTDHHQQTSNRVGRPPTARQQCYLRQLALARGVTFVPPRTCFEASRLIDQLKRREPDAPADRRRPYLSERQPTTMAELEAIVHDYLAQAACWDAIPAAGPCWLADRLVEARLR